MLSLYGNLLLFSRHSAGAEPSASLSLGPATNWKDEQLSCIQLEPPFGFSMRPSFAGAFF